MTEDRMAFGSSLGVSVRARGDFRIAALAAPGDELLRDDLDRPRDRDPEERADDSPELGPGRDAHRGRKGESLTVGWYKTCERVW
jgi:hypothetical protein